MQATALLSWKKIKAGSLHFKSIIDNILLEIFLSNAGPRALGYQDIPMPVLDNKNLLPIRFHDSSFMLAKLEFNITIS